MGKETIKTGDWFWTGRGELYILSAISFDVILVSMNGGFWSVPVTVKDIKNITKEEFKQITGDGYMTFTKVDKKKVMAGLTKISKWYRIQ